MENQALTDAEILQIGEISKALEMANERLVAMGHVEVLLESDEEVDRRAAKHLLTVVNKVQGTESSMDLHLEAEGSFTESIRRTIQAGVDLLAKLIKKIMDFFFRLFGRNKEDLNDIDESVKGFEKEAKESDRFIKQIGLESGDDLKPEDLKKAADSEVKPLVDDNGKVATSKEVFSNLLKGRRLPKAYSQYVLGLYTYNGKFTDISSAIKNTADAIEREITLLSDNSLWTSLQYLTAIYSDKDLADFINSLSGTAGRVSFVKQQEEVFSKHSGAKKKMRSTPSSILAGKPMMGNCFVALVPVKYVRDTSLQVPAIFGMESTDGLPKLYSKLSPQAKNANKKKVKPEISLDELKEIRMELGRLVALQGKIHSMLGAFRDVTAFVTSNGGKTITESIVRLQELKAKANPDVAKQYDDAIDGLKRSSKIVGSAVDGYNSYLQYVSFYVRLTGGLINAVIDVNRNTKIPGLSELVVK